MIMYMHYIIIIIYYNTIHLFFVKETYEISEENSERKVKKRKSKEEIWKIAQSYRSIQIQIEIKIHTHTHTYTIELDLQEKLRVLVCSCVSRAGDPRR